MTVEAEPKQWFLRTSYPVDFPTHGALTMSPSDYAAFLAKEVRWNPEAMSEPTDASVREVSSLSDTYRSNTFTRSRSNESSEQRRRIAEILELFGSSTDVADEAEAKLQSWSGDLGVEVPVPNMENMMLTENGAVTHRTTTNALVDLFSELEDTMSGPSLRDALQAAWKEDPLVTLKIIFNSRSIHLGKSSRTIFYRAAGWLALNHPLTLLSNLQWLSRPIIEKKIRTPDDAELVIVEVELDRDEHLPHDIKHGVSHGYWKDLLNILTLAVNNKLNGFSSPCDVFNTHNEPIRAAVMARRANRQRHPDISQPAALALNTKAERKRWTGMRTSSTQDAAEESSGEDGKPSNMYGHNRETAKKAQNKIRDDRHQRVVTAFNTNPFYRVLHLTVARLFAEQLLADLEAMRSKDARKKSTISLCAKWAPSHGNFHDRHTFIISSIAEIMYPQLSFSDEQVLCKDREMYLRHAREKYREDVSALRKQLQVVERDITANNFQNIKYDRVPSLAMNNYTNLFAQKDFTRFEKYMDRVAEGKATISGATLLPSTLILKASQAGHVQSLPTEESTEDWLKTHSVKELTRLKIHQIEAKVIDGQWNTLVKRIKDSGRLSSSIAVCDVSGSMSSPKFSDETSPIHTAIGLSLLIAEVTEPPFGGSFITFSAEPEIQTVNVSESLTNKYLALSNADWGFNTDFLSVFDKLLSMAQSQKLKPEEMVKRVFVFSDMQFDAAQQSSRGEKPIAQWNTSYKTIAIKYGKFGYEMPEMIFWNLAGGSRGTSIAPKPVTVTDEGTCLVSGYSQGMLKVFLENGNFEGPGDSTDSEDEVLLTQKPDGTLSEETNKKGMDPLALVRKAVGHKAYDMLQIVD